MLMPLTHDDSSEKRLSINHCPEELMCLNTYVKEEIIHWYPDDTHSENVLLQYLPDGIKNTTRSYSVSDPKVKI